MKALFISRNLIGDGLTIGPALREWHRRNPDAEIDLLTLPDHVVPLYCGMGVRLRVITDDGQRADSYDFEFVFDVNKAFTLGEEKHCHIAEAYYEMLFGEVLPVADRCLTYEPPEVGYRAGLVLVAPFSRSCSSRESPPKPPNKMLPWPHWWHILTLLRQVGRIGILGGPDDRAPLPVSEEEYYTGLPLPVVAGMLRDARLLVTIDNGMAHLGASQRTPMIEFYPACLSLNWAVPIGNPNAIVVQVNPANLSLAETALVIRQGVRKLREMDVLL